MTQYLGDNSIFTVMPLSLVLGFIICQNPDGLHSC